MTSAIILFALRMLLILILYGFLAGALLILWKDMRVAPSSDLVPKDIYLVGEQEEEIYPLAVDNSIGRAADNAIRLMDETVSAYHARLSYQHGHWMLEDLDSKNGTHVNGVLLEGSLVVTYGDVIETGRVSLTLTHRSRPDADPLEFEFGDKAPAAEHAEHPAIQQD